MTAVISVVINNARKDKIPQREEVEFLKGGAHKIN